jgi:hypothetical protein
MTQPLETNEANLEQAIQLMIAFADRTGLTSDRPAQRYLWTDAFAVCNFLALARATGEKHHAELALQLVERVHATLGRHRPDDGRRGWLSGLSEAEGAAHPTRGGLRIGKPLPERGFDEPFDDELEWERDGQYFHYLTKWMHALDQVARFTRDVRYSRWARELADVAHAAFRYAPLAGGRTRLVWKMSIDLSRPLVPSMGQHDPLDGLITVVQLQATAEALDDARAAPMLTQALASFAGMLSGDFVTPDPLGIGGLLADAARVAQLIEHPPLSGDLLCALLDAATRGLAHYTRTGDGRAPASQRLGFRELGLSLGLHAVELVRREARTHLARFSDIQSELHARLERLDVYVPLGATIEAFWQHPSHWDARSWSSHRDINEVMLATSLLPEGFLRRVEVA